MLSLLIISEPPVKRSENIEQPNFKLSNILFFKKKFCSSIALHFSRIRNTTLDQFLLDDGPALDSQQEHQADGFDSPHSC